MSQVGVGASNKNEPFSAASSASYAAKSAIQHSPADLAIILTKNFQKTEELAEAANKASGTSNVIGATSSAIFSSLPEENLNAITLLMKAGKIKFKISSQEIKNEPLFISGQKLGSSLIDRNLIDKHCLLLFAPNTNKNLQELIRGVQSSLGKSFPIFGMVSAMQNNTPNKQYYRRESKDNLATALLLGGEMNFSFAISHGWKALGKTHRVTRSSKNIIHEIENKPAIDIYRQYLGEQVFGWDKNYFQKTSFIYPLGIPLRTGQEHLIRSGLIAGENGSLICQGEIPESCEARIMINTASSCLETAGKVAAKSLAEFKQGEPKFVLLFSSIARYNLLGRNYPKEINSVKHALPKNVPIIGCCSAAEIAPINFARHLGESFLYNNSALLLMIGD